MHNEKLRIVILVGSTREGRFGYVVAAWFERLARQRADMVFDVMSSIWRRPDCPP